MASNGSGGEQRGWRRALQRLFTGGGSDDAGGPSKDDTASGLRMPARIGHYTILRKLGEGGMGAVYAARDPRLERTVAVKVITRAGDDTARQRFWREARAAAGLNHPNICQVHDIGEEAGALFIAMELLEGEPLSHRLKAGPMRVADAMPIALGMLSALSAVHGRGLVHRDLKPSNIFLTPHGVKLLDFGLARAESDGMPTEGNLTQTGLVIGTPRYMAPEQALGEVVDARCDLFATGAILFEMLAGRPAFNGRSLVDILHATVHEQPPALTGSPAVAAIDRVIRRALAKNPVDRYPSADEFLHHLRATAPNDSGDTRAIAQPLTRVVVLPFRVLRPDAETDFLAFSLPDAIATSLSGVNSLVVRSSATAAHVGAESPDLKALAAEADVDRVVLGTLLRSGGEVRVTAQLVEAPGGTLLTSQSVHAPLGDLFALQDDLARRIVAALTPPLSSVRTSWLEEGSSPAEQAPRPVQARAGSNAPDPVAYELYLRGNQLARSFDSLPAARDLYLRALEHDPRFAPAWAQLGRANRVIGKFVEPMADSEARAEEAFERALALDPDLSVAHKFYAGLECDTGRAEDGSQRLLREASRRSNDPELYAGLVHTLRYTGLFEESVAAHTEARRLDPNVATSIEQTLLLLGDVERLLALKGARGGGDEGIRVMGLGLAGRRDEARDLLLVLRESLRLPVFQAWTAYLLAWLDRRVEDMRVQLGHISGLRVHHDPEALFLRGWLACDAGADEDGLVYLQHAVARGYNPVSTLRMSQFDGLRGLPMFTAIQADADAGRASALGAFRKAGGERLLGRAGVLA